MESSGATAPLIVLGVAGLGLLLVAVTSVLLQRPARSRAPSVAPASRELLHDDLPTFRAHPPGSPGAAVRESSTAAPVALAGPAVPGALSRAEAAPGPLARTNDGVRVTGFLLALAALALALIAAAAAVAIAAPAARADRPVPTPPASGTATASAPELPAVPDSPAPGQPGAGELAYLSLPLGRGDVAARLSFDGVVLEQQAVGATVTRPTASLTTAGHRALLHLRLPTWNCLAPDAPADPAAAGCMPSVTEYGDLPSPALSFSSDGKTLLLGGRVPTYIRPNGSGPVYTGRVYDVTLTVTPGRRPSSGRYAADGRLTLGSGMTRTDGEPALNVITQGG